MTRSATGTSPATTSRSGRPRAEPEAALVEGTLVLELDADGARDALVTMDEVGAGLSAHLLPRAERFIDDAASDEVLVLAMTADPEHAAGEYDVGLTEHGGDDQLFEAPVPFQGGTSYTLLLLGTMDDLEGLVLEDGS